jgi:hypothetical protein
MRKSQQINISTARLQCGFFQTVLLLHGFNQRILKEEPIVAPTILNDISLRQKNRVNYV